VATGFDIGDQVVWVTGSTRGIGRGVAEHLARCGARVAVHGRDAATVDATVAALDRDGGSAHGVVADVRDPEAMAAAAGSVAERFGRLDGLVANVGGAAMGPMAGIDVERFRRQLDLNLTGAFAAARAAHPLLRAARGSAVLISATAAAGPTPQFGPYGAAKAAVEHLAGSLAAEWGPEIRVNCVSPGLVRTEGSLHSVFRGSEELAARAGRTTAVGRVGEPQDVAYACHYLLSPAARFVSGAVLVVDGGRTEGPAQRIMRALET
jgi:NAD(P)-dependent dehydrogenase (short-subunit alcohol dehydrogenase family)